MNHLQNIVDWMADPEGSGQKSVIDIFFIIGLTVLFTGFWIMVYRRVFNKKLLG